MSKNSKNYLATSGHSMFAHEDFLKKGHFCGLCKKRQYFVPPNSFSMDTFFVYFVQGTKNNFSSKLCVRR
jgi:hypothetical protein